MLNYLQQFRSGRDMQQGRNAPMIASSIAVPSSYIAGSIFLGLCDWSTEHIKSSVRGLGYVTDWIIPRLYMRCPQTIVQRIRKAGHTPVPPVLCYCQDRDAKSCTGEPPHSADIVAPLVIPPPRPRHSRRRLGDTKSSWQSRSSAVITSRIASPGRISLHIQPTMTIARIAANLLLELTRRTLRHNLAVVDDRQPPTEAIRLIHHLRRQDDGDSLVGVQLAQVIPQGDAALRIEAGRRFIKEKHLRLMHKRCHEVQPTPHPAGERPDLLIRDGFDSPMKSNSSAQRARVGAAEAV